jgi:O-antigen biosynthesis protein
MASSDSARQPLLHVYQRKVANDCQDSLSVIATMVKSGTTLLDLGMGAGGLGQQLHQRPSIVCDGVTLNRAEADIAKTWYREVVVADLDEARLSALFGNKLYDYIVCADVLEHLKTPQNLLHQCKTLLKPGGRLLTSVPNAGYCGLVAELIQGDFRYRSEGLLDETHLRFFTRISLKRFFDESRWETESTYTIQRSLAASEFQVGFDVLPPSVARHLLALPDALTYQFITVLTPVQSLAPTCTNGLEFSATPTETETAIASQLQPANALFSAQLYLATEAGYDEATKLVVPGCIGNPNQTLVFDIPPSPKPYMRIRLDPADRPGFFRLFHLQLRLPDGQTVWRWQADRDPLTDLADSPQQSIVFAAPWEMAAGALLLLHSDDPWMELPLSSDLLQQVSQTGANFEVCAGWPMSADYLQASIAIDALKETQRVALEQSLALHKEQISRLNGDHTHTANQQRALIENSELEFRTKVSSLTEANEESARETERLSEALHVTQVETRHLNNELQLARADAHTRVQGLVEEMAAAQREAQSEKQRLTGELRTTQRAQQLAQQRFDQIAAHVQSIERSTMFRATRPLSRMKGRVDRILGQGPKQISLKQLAPIRRAIPAADFPVDIIVPVFRGLDDTRCCLESVLAAPGRARWRLIIINDCSPEREITEWLRAFALRDARIQLLENSQNLGFVATVNRGMAISHENDVVLLNSDAEVANDWLDRIQRAAYSAPRVASVTPFSNNATICSYPRFCQANVMPGGLNTASLDKLFAQNLAGEAVEIPTGVGFCMYIRRQCLQEIGLFDVANFGKGYGEENDFCIRAEEAGWTNLHALDVFVRHAGGISFGDTKSARELQAMETLRRLHPGYESNVHAYVLRDPAGPARTAIDIARITASGCPVILTVMHDREGGTLRHVQDLATQLEGFATFLRLSPAPGGAELRLEGAQEGFALQLELPREQPRLLNILRLLQVGHIHYHHLVGHASDICDLPALLGVSHDFTAHDYYSYCPQISLTDHTERYCGERGLDQCRQCVQRNPAPSGESIESWRNRHARLLGQARYVITPSGDTGRRMQHFVPTAVVRVVPHASLELVPPVHPTPKPRRLSGTQPLKIVVLGALSKIKGADILEEVALLASSKKIPVEFHLLGFAYRSLRTEPKSRLTVHGAYKEHDLPQLLQSLQADAVWFPAVWPETYSYTLSASLDAGLPIIAPNIGAFGERLQKRDWSWLCDWQQTANDWLSFFDRIRQQNFLPGIGPSYIQKSDSEISPGETRRTGQNDDQSLAYRTSYLRTLPVPHVLSALELTELKEQLPPQTQLIRAADQPAAAIKSATLRTVIRLRASPALSPVAKLIPMHLQRRVKTWLGR